MPRATGKIEVVAEASNGAECLMLLEEQDPDAWFLDIELGDLSGLDIAHMALVQGNPPFLVAVRGRHVHAAQRPVV